MTKFEIGNEVEMALLNGDALNWVGGTITQVLDEYVWVDDHRVHQSWVRHPQKYIYTVCATDYDGNTENTYLVSDVPININEKLIDAMVLAAESGRSDHDYTFGYLYNMVVNGNNMYSSYIQAVGLSFLEEDGSADISQGMSVRNVEYTKAWVKPNDKWLASKLRDKNLYIKPEPKHPPKCHCCGK